MATGAASAPLSVRLLVGAKAEPAPSAEEAAKGVAEFLAVPVGAAVRLLGKECLMDSAGNLYAILEKAEALPSAGAVLHQAAPSSPAGAASAVVGSAKRLLALAGALSPGADVGVLSRAMEELERLAGGGMATDRTEASPSTAADMDIDSGGGAVSSSNQLGGTGESSAKRKREARRRGCGGDGAPGLFERPAKRRILAWRVRWYRALVAKARATAARRARSRGAQLVRRRTAGRRTDSLQSVQQRLARATLSDGVHRWSPGGGGAAA